MKNTMLLFTTMLLCAVQPVYSMEKEKEPEKIIEELFDQPGFFEGSRPISTRDPEKKSLLLEIKNSYKKDNGCTIPNLHLNAIAKNLLNAHRTEIIIPDNQDQ